MTIKLIWRDKDIRQQVFSTLLIAVILVLFWVFLYVGISSEVERRSDIPQKAKRAWMQERAVNEYHTEQTQLMKAMHRVQGEK